MTERSRLTDRPRLQIALDAFDLPSALGPLQKASANVDVIECGTILILCEGYRAVRVVRALYPDKPVLADVRIAEAGKDWAAAEDALLRARSIISAGRSNAIFDAEDLLVLPQLPHPPCGDHARDLGWGGVEQRDQDDAAMPGLHIGRLVAVCFVFEAVP